MARQYLIPGYGYINDRGSNRQSLVPGYGYVNELSTDFVDFLFGAMTQPILSSVAMTQSKLASVALVS